MQAWEIVRAMRPHQWTKNAVIFVPLVLSHHYFDVASLGNALLAFVVFSLAAFCLDAGDGR